MKTTQTLDKPQTHWFITEHTKHLMDIVIARTSPLFCMRELKAATACLEVFSLLPGYQESTNDFIPETPVPSPDEVGELRQVRNPV